MTKAELAYSVAQKTGIELHKSLEAVEAALVTIQLSLMQGKGVFIRGFGSFTVAHRAQKTARNISKRTTIIVPPHFEPAFKPSKAFKNKVDKERKSKLA